MSTESQAARDETNESTELAQIVVAAMDAGRRSRESRREKLLALEQVRIDMGKKILRSQAENLWALGVIGLGPHPIVVSNDLRNVPRHGYWGWDSRWSWPYFPETWYLQRGG